MLKHFGNLDSLSRASVEELEKLGLKSSVALSLLEKLHELKALEDNTIAFCVHALRDKETGDILDPSQVPLGIDASLSGMAKPL